MIILYCLLIVLLTTEITTKPAQDDNTEKCGYDSCHPVKPGMLNVHLVPHTHDDVGWLKTVDQYYFGSKSNIQKAGVQYILDSVVQELMKDPNKRFIYVETSYLWKWWKKQHDTLRHQVKKLVNRGQLEFIGGGWSMNDEAVTHYQSIIDQFTWGLRKLNETFGACGRPKIGWQIDPFGHSREMASIFAQLGYDGMFFGRLDYQDKRERMTTKTAEMIWQGSASLGNSSEIFTSVLYNNYGPPPGFCFDVLCDDEPIIDDKKSPEYNVDMKVAGFLYFAKQQAKYYSTNNIIFTMGGDFTFMDAHMWYSNLDKLIRNYQTNNVIVTMGEDFNYQDAKMWFSNLDKLIRHANALQSNGSNINLLYSTPSCYLKAVYDEGKSKKWPVKTDDFFPYASDPNAYWTGYFTSRPTIKRFERIGNNYLQICKQLYSLTDLGPEDWVDLNVLREAMGVLQHHDAITGTEKEHVAHDYARILTKGFEECDIITNTALNKIITSRTKNAPKLELNNCMLLNISQCDVSETSENFVVTVYNPLSRPVSSYVRVPVTGQSYSVTDPSGTDLTIQLSPIPESLLNIPGRSSKATVELIFHASDLPPLGFKSYFIKESHLYDMTITESEDLNIKDGDTEIRFDENTGLLSHIKLNGIDVKLSQNFLWYQSAVGDNQEFLNRSSGAYIFRPNGTRVTPVSDGAKTKSFNGPLIAEIHQTFNEWVSQVIRYYKQDSYVEFEWLVGPIPIADKLGKEIITRYTTKLNSNGIFYTDSNGREMLKRVRNYRPTWKVLLNETIAGNYYPVTSKILIRDPVQDVEVAVMTDRAQGGSSLADGDIELMVHRRILHDDAFGVGEALNEKAYGKGLVARGQHYVIFGPYKNTTKSSIAAKEKDIAQRKLLSAWTFITPIENLSYQQYKAQYKMQYSGLKRALPKNIQILTLEPWHGSTFLLRLEHVLEKTEDPELSKPVDVDIRNLFTPFTIKSAKETMLGANQWVTDHQKFNWKTGETLENLMNHEDYIEQTRRFRYNPINTNEIPNDQPYEEIDNVILKELEQLNDFLFTLKPMEIRTFVIEID